MSNETKFTEGEWHVDSYVEVDGSVRVVMGNIIITYHGHATDEDVANAHLIASAPEMYSELQNLLHDSMDCDEYNRIEKLLAKARGEV